MQSIVLDERNIEMIGNVLTGNLYGTWNDVKINHGNVTMHQSFAKIPRHVKEKKDKINKLLLIL